MEISLDVIGGFLEVLDILINPGLAKESSSVSLALITYLAGLLLMTCGVYEQIGTYTWWFLVAIISALGLLGFIEGYERAPIVLLGAMSVGFLMKAVAGFSLGMCLARYRSARFALFTLVVTSSVALPVIQSVSQEAYGRTIAFLRYLTIVVASIAASVVTYKYAHFTVSKPPEGFPSIVMCLSVGTITAASCMLYLGWQARVMFFGALVFGIYLTRSIRIETG